MLKDKHIILGVSGSIAAYKAAFLLRLLKKQGANVQVVMTEAATQFIPELTMSTLSKKPVFIQPAKEGQWNNHVEIGREADAFIIAPASANTLAKMSQGICDNMLLATYLSATCPIFIAPAMDVDMWHHPATSQNIQTLTERGTHLIEVNEGELASGLFGEGRMAEPEDIIQHLQDFFREHKRLEGLKALVTAGPTHEPLDPVRFIGNHSSGKMGIAIAEALAASGAQVHLVLGPTYLRPSHPKIKTHQVTTAREMKVICDKLFPSSDIAVLAAAVADYRPLETAKQKIKKAEKEPHLRLIKNPDILKSLGQQKKENQILVGFALETEQEEKNALKKLKEKQLDFIVLNSLQDTGAGFKTETNKVTIFHANGEKNSYPLLSKKKVAQNIVEHLTTLYEKEN